MFDGGAFGQSKLVVRVPPNDTVTFENATVPDKYHPEFKVLALLGSGGSTAIAHGIQAVKVIASPGSTVEFGDTSEVNIQFSIVGAARLKFSGTAQPDLFEIEASGVYYAKKNHFTVGDLFTSPSNPNALLLENPLVPGVGSTTIPDPEDGFIGLFYLPTRWADPMYAVKRVFGTNGRTQTITFAVSDADASSIILDGKGAADTYNVEQGVGGFLDVTIEDADATTQNTATVRLRESDIVYSNATLTDNSLAVEFYTMPTFRENIATRMLLRYPQFYRLAGYFGWTDSVYYSPTVFWGANVTINLEFAVKFQEFLIDRPTAPQDAGIRFGVASIVRSRLPPGGFSGDSTFNVGLFPNLPLWVHDTDVTGSEIVILGPAPVTTVLRALVQKPALKVQNNAGNLSVDLQFQRNATEFSASQLTRNMGLNVDIDSNSGALFFQNVPLFGSGIPSATNLSTFNIIENSGTLNFDFPELPTVLGTMVNVLGNSGTININNGNGLGTAGVKLKFGDNGSLANVHDAVNLSGNGAQFNVTFDDRNNIAPGRFWDIDSAQLHVGDLTVSFLRPFLGIVGTIEVRPNPGSTVLVKAVPAGATTPIKVFGSGNENTLAGPNLTGVATWRVDGPDSGSMQLTSYQQLVWQNMQTLKGNSGDDRFEIQSLGSITGSLDGGDGLNTLTYTSPPNPLVVDLVNRTATRVDGEVFNIQSVLPEMLTFSAPAELQNRIADTVSIGLSATSTTGPY